LAEELSVESRRAIDPPTPHAAGRGVAKIGAGVLLASVLYVVGSLALFLPSAAPISFAVAASDASHSFLEENIHRAAARQDASSAAASEAPQLFGLDTEPVGEGALLEKWRHVEADIANDLDVVAQCKAGKPCPAPAQKLIELSLQGANRAERARVGLINRAIDLAISPVEDQARWGVLDHWSDPFETLHAGVGDCEDYAIVKYAALRTAGFPKDAVKLVVLRNRFPDEDHAVAAVRVDDQWLILDNRTLTLVRDIDLIRAIPRFVLDDDGVRRFVAGRRHQRSVDVAQQPAIAFSLPGGNRG
jgi:predicted transglutaminase-like cysteine proteinase